MQTFRITAFFIVLALETQLRAAQDGLSVKAAEQAAQTLGQKGMNKGLVALIIEYSNPYKAIKARIYYSETRSEEHGCSFQADVEVPKNGEITLEEILKLAAGSNLYHVGGGVHGLYCLGRVKGILKSDPSTFNKYHVGWYQSENGSPGAKLSQFQEKNQDTVHFSNC